jgi:hypothetical protein
MTDKWRRAVTAFVFAVAAVTAGPAVALQRPPDARPAPGDTGALPPGEIQRLFDAYVILQAQDALNLNEAQFAQFVTRLRALQEVRRKAQQQRQQIIRDLGRLADPKLGTVDEGQIKEKLKVLSELDARGPEEVRKAYAALDQLLDVRQQARFRVFEEQVERRKFELLLRARRAGAGNRIPRNNQPPRPDRGLD